jgi:hypothetical protein
MNQKEETPVQNEPLLGLVETDSGMEKPFRKNRIRTALALLLYIVFIPFLLYLSPAIPELFIRSAKPGFTAPGGEQETRIKKLGSEINALERKIDRFTPGNAYLVVNTTENRFALYRNRKLVREGLCSTGSYISLEGEDNKNWIFKTPRGDFKVRGKITDPVWRKPDWAFVEEGLPIPSANHPSRYERGVLGDYALALGDGYLIHGTLYQRFLGLPVTHGCIRMNDADLKEVYESLPVGAKVFIY